MSDKSSSDVRMCGGACESCGGVRPCEPMDDAIVERLRTYIASNYATFATSELTFRNLKEHLVKTIDGLDLHELSLGVGKFGDTLDDEVDAIAVRCDGGSRNVACVFLPDYEPPVEINLLATFNYGTELACAGGALVAAAALFAFARRRRAKRKHNPIREKAKKR